MNNNKSNKDIEHFNHWSRTYDESWIQRYANRLHTEMLNVVSKENAAPDTILDIGCGTGQLLNKAHTLYPTAQLFGVDPAEGMVNIARERLTSATIYLSTAEILPLPDSSVDVALSSLSFHHWSNKLTALKEIRRVLRPGGCFCLADITVPVWVSKLFRNSMFNSPLSISKLFDEAGLKVNKQHRTFTRFIWLTLGVKE